MTPRWPPGPVRRQDVEATNDDEETETRARRFSQSCLKLEAIRTCDGSLLGFFGHESCFTHPV